MSILESIISFLQYEIETPTMYGWFHIMCLILTLVLTIFLIKKCPNDRKALLVMSIIMIALEIYKQISFSYDDGVWSYRWYAFPFQFCSTPMYVAFLASIIKNEKIKSSLYSFLATYGLVAGISVMLYPNTVFIRELLIDIQTMVHHGFMVVMGLYLILTNKVKFNKKTFIKATLVFTILVLIALFGNVLTYYLNIDEGLELFYISPYHTSILPVYSIIYEKVPYILFLIIYIVSFSIGSIIPFGIVEGIKKIKNVLL